MEKGKIDYQVPVTHLKGAKGDGGNRRYASSKIIESERDGDMLQAARLF